MQLSGSVNHSSLNTCAFEVLLWNTMKVGPWPLIGPSSSGGHRKAGGPPQSRTT